MTAHDTRRAIDAVWRIESARIIAVLARMVRDVGLAEELAQDALVSALERWPESGIPDKPGAWLTAVAKRRAIDHLRRRKLLERKHEELGRELEAEQQIAVADFDAGRGAGGADDADNEIDDDLLRLVFVACHPVLSSEARVALTLRLLGGLTTEEIARAFLVPEPTIAQRIVRAKRTLAEAHRSGRCARPAGRSRPRALGSSAHRSRSQGARARRGTRRRLRPLCVAGRDRRLSRARAYS